MAGQPQVTVPAQGRAGLEALIAAPGVTRVSPPILVPADPYFHLAGEQMRRRLVLAAGDGPDYCLRPDFTLPIARTYLADAKGPAAFSYLGPVFRSRAGKPVEFEQAGIELMAQPDADEALDTVFGFALDALSAYGISAPRIRLGSVAMFEALLAGVDLPAVWRPRLRDRFGDTAIASLIDRLDDPHGSKRDAAPPARKILVADIASQMMEAGLPLGGSRAPEEIADRLLEKKALDAAHAPRATIERLQTFLAISAPVDEGCRAATAVGGGDAAFSSAVATLQRHAQSLAERAPDAEIVLDAGFAPRLDYYTGIVFEISSRSGGTLASGGQYDRLLQRLGAPAEIAASGCSVWVERLEREGTECRP